MAPYAYPPPEVIASWPKPNYTNPETRGPALLITSITLSVIGLMVVAARIYARLFITKAPGVDDAIIVVALLLAIGSSVLITYGSEVLYVGYHVWDVPPGASSAMHLNAWCSQWFYAGALCAVKISLLLFYRRLSVTFSNFFLWATWIGIGYNFLVYITYVLIIILECRPTSAYWLSSDPTWLAEGHTYTCTNVESVVLPLYSALSVIGDFYTTTLPLCLVYTLHMSRRQKMSLYCLFALGYLVVGAGMIKTVYVNDLVNKTYDTPWVYYESMIWTTVELYFAIYCASAPGLKPFVKTFFIEPITQDTASLNPKSQYTFGSSGKERSYSGNPAHRYLNHTDNDEESWTLNEIAVELSKSDKQDKGKKTGVTIHETDEFFDDRPRHSLIPKETRSDLEQHRRTQQSPNYQYGQYQREQQSPKDQCEDQHRQIPSQNTTLNTTAMNNHNGEVPILAAPVILDSRASHAGQVVPFVMCQPPPEPRQSGYASPRTDLSSATISASPIPKLEAPSEISENGSETDSRDGDFELPLQGTRENSPTDMQPMVSRAVPAADITAVG